MISQIELIIEISKAISKHGNPNVSTSQLNSIISAADMILASLNAPEIKATAGMGLCAWYQSDDTGWSSMYMASVIYGEVKPYAHPHDSDDFGRCYRFLRAVPGTREKLNMLSDKSEYWRLLIEDWDNLEKLFELQQETEKSKKYPCLDRMNELQKMAKQNEEAKIIESSAS